MFIFLKKYYLVSILVSYLFIILFITPSSLSAPSFWGEEANVYFKFAYENDWLTTLLSPHLGYYSFFANLTALLAVNLLPIEYAPFVTAYLTLVVYLLLGIWVVLPNSPFQTWQQQVLVLLAILFLPPLHGKLSTLLGHFYFTIFVLLILISNTKHHNINLLNRILLVCAGLTGSIAAFFVPAYWINFILQKDKERLIQSSLLSICALIQISVFVFDLSVIYPDGYRASRFGNFEVDIFIFTLFSRFIVANLLGYENMMFFSSYLKNILLEKHFLYYFWLFCCSISLSYLFFLMLKNSKTFLTGILLFCFCLITFLSYISSTDAGFHPTTGISKIFLLSGKAPRYFYLSNLILFIYLLLIISNSIFNKIVIYIIICITLAVAMYDQSHRFKKNYNSLTENYSWQYEVSLWKENPNYYLKSPPTGVSFQLKPRETALDKP